MRTVIISGVTGFVGNNFKKYIDKDFECIGLSRTTRQNQNIKSYNQITTDDYNKSTAFIHLAGKAHDLKNTSEEQEYFEVNTELTKKLFNQFLESDCEVFIYMSSVKAVRDSVEGVLREDVVPNPQTPYGKSKLAAENYILSKGIPPTKRVYILRPCMIHGPNNKGNLNLLYSFVSKGVPYPLGKYQNKRSFVSVKNLCFIINELIENKTIPSGIYNIADDASLSTIKLVKIIGQVIQKPAKILHIPKYIVNTIAKLGDVLPLPINSERLQKLTENYVVSNAKIKKAIKKELPLTTEKGIEKTIASFL